MERMSADGIAFIGKVDLLNQVVSCLFGTEYAKVDQHKVGNPCNFHSSWFLWGDKGCFRAWGLNADGKVVCGIRFMDDATPEIEVVAMDCCYDWGS